jgi:hypothetical protein
VHDLERKLDLDTQFETFHERETRDAFDSAATATFDQVRERFPDRPAFLLFWQLNDSTAAFESKFNKAFGRASGSGIPIFRINLDMEQDAYEAAKIYERKHRHNVYFQFGGSLTVAPPISLRGGYGLQSELSQRFQVPTTPTLVLLVPDEEPLMYAQNLSHKSTLKDLKKYRKAFKRKAKADRKAQKHPSAG